MNCNSKLKSGKFYMCMSMSSMSMMMCRSYFDELNKKYQPKRKKQ